MMKSLMFYRFEVVAALRRLREEIEGETGDLTEEQALLLVDVCDVLGFDDGETMDVMGQGLSLLDRLGWRLLEGREGREGRTRSAPTEGGLDCEEPVSAIGPDVDFR